VTRAPLSAQHSEQQAPTAVPPAHHPRLTQRLLLCVPESIQAAAAPVPAVGPVVVLAATPVALTTTGRTPITPTRLIVPSTSTPAAASSSSSSGGAAAACGGRGGCGGCCCLCGAALAGAAGGAGGVLGWGHVPVEVLGRSSLLWGSGAGADSRAQSTKSEDGRTDRCEGGRPVE
jgi:hypothetical protein